MVLADVSSPIAQVTRLAVTALLEPELEPIGERVVSYALTNTPPKPVWTSSDSAPGQKQIEQAVGC